MTLLTHHQCPDSHKGSLLDKVQSFKSFFINKCWFSIDLSFLNWNLRAKAQSGTDWANHVVPSFQCLINETLLHPIQIQFHQNQCLWVLPVSSSEILLHITSIHIFSYCSSLLYYNRLHLGLNTKDSSHISSNFPVMLLMLKMTARNGGTTILDNSRMRTCFPYMISVLVLPAGICNSTGIRYCPDHSSLTLTRKKQEWMNVNTDTECEWMYSMLLCNSSSLNVRSNTTTTRRGNKSKERLRYTLLYSLPVESMLAWQHSQLVFHFEVLQTHGARLLCKWQTGRSETDSQLMKCIM